jgi:hypothetical protein
VVRAQASLEGAKREWVIVDEDDDAFPGVVG